jgi:hypothetical protein
VSTLQSILDLLNKWPEWKRVTEAPDRVDELERRMAALEEKLKKAPGERCPKCGELSLRASGSGPARGAAKAAGAREHIMVCETDGCGFKDYRTVYPEGILGR